MFKSTKAKTLETILQSFNQTIADLQEVVKSSQQKHDDNLKEINRLDYENTSLKAQRDTAQSVSEKISALISQ